MCTCNLDIGFKTPAYTCYFYLRYFRTNSIGKHAVGFVSNCRVDKSVQHFR